jgi:hypothetical protein
VAGTAGLLVTQRVTTRVTPGVTPWGGSQLYTAAPSPSSVPFHQSSSRHVAAAAGIRAMLLVGLRGLT